MKIKITLIFLFLLPLSLLYAQGTFDCMPGQYDNRDGGCVDCPVGTFSSQQGQLQCEPCAIGTYQDEPGRSECKTCPPGTTNSVEGSASIDSCIPIEEAPLMNRWSLLLLAGLVLATGFFLLRRAKQV